MGIVIIIAVLIVVAFMIAKLKREIAQKEQNERSSLPSYQAVSQDQSANFVARNAPVNQM